MLNNFGLPLSRWKEDTQSCAVSQGKEKIRVMWKEFEDPGKEFRPIPFWSWNDTLETGELERQIDLMKQAGMGGYFMHARAGLTQEYLGEQWFDAVRTGIEQGAARSLDPWVYDEEGWPSGFAGGIVPKMSPHFQARYLKYAVYGKTQEAELDQAWLVYVLHPAGYRKVTLKDVREGRVVLGEGERLAVIRSMVQKTYIDVMNKEAVEAFLQVTHEEYQKRFGQEFGKGLKGFFTDEPRFTCGRFGDMPWSEGLEEEFGRRYGYSLIDNILCLWNPLQDYERVRYHFWKMVNDLFVHNYMETLYRWCEDHHCMLTGHIMMEESIFGQMTGTGGVMPFYEYEHIPGIDWLRRRIESPVIAKQVGSVACQLGKKKVLTESFALSGWNISFEEMKWILEWQYVNGVNLLCQHLEAYSLKGSRKRDYPPSIFYQQSYYRVFRKFTDYIARLGAALAQGNQLADVLVVHPMRSGYVSYDGSRPEAVRVLDDRFRELSQYLSGAHISYHYGDETIMGKYAAVEKDRLRVGQVSYQTVILPHMYSLDESTLKLLVRFGQEGGCILSVGEFPHFTDGDPALLQELSQFTVSVETHELRTYLAGKGLVATGIEADGEQITCIEQQIRQTDAGLLLFLVNTSQTQGFTADISVYDRRARVWLLSADDGRQSLCESRSDGKHTLFSMTFAPMQSRLVLLEEQSGVAQDCGKGSGIGEGPEDERLTITEEQPHEPDVIRVVPGNHWRIEEMGSNSLTLDICRYSVDGGELTGTLPVIHLMKLLLDRRKDSHVEMEFVFTAEFEPEGCRELKLAMEDMELYRISVNGSLVCNEAEGWWKDRAFQTVDIRPFVLKGENVIRLEGVFHQDPYVYQVLYGEGMYETEKNKLTYNMELESVYLVGDFGVRSLAPFIPGERGSLFTDGPFVLTDSPTEFTDNNFTCQGLCFFAEDILVSQKMNIRRESGKRVILSYGKPNAPAADILVNGSLARTACWAPYEVDITDLCVDGENTLALRLYSSNRNLLGPHHHTKGESYGVGPLSFTGKWSWVERESEADGTDFEDRNRDYWTDAYAFVDFGPGGRAGSENIKFLKPEIHAKGI